MASLWTGVRTGEWLIAARLRNYPIILLVISAVGFVAWIMLADGLIDRTGQPIGTDFSNVYAAGTLVWDGEPGAAYDPARQHAAEKAVFGGREVAFYGWHYPPPFFVVAAALALLPYAWALVAWMTITLIPYVMVVRAILPHPETALIATAFPAVFVNIGHGQNGFLTAALLGGGLWLLDRRPVVAGILFGLLAYKPHFGLLIPLVLLATGRWRVIAAAAVTVAAECAVTLGLFGTKVWPAFAGSLEFTRRVVLETGNTGWEKIQSLFSAARMWGADVDTAYAAHALLVLALAASLVWLWRSGAAYELKAAALACACLLAPPYVLDYDLVVLAIAIAFFVRHALAGGFKDYEVTVLAFVWTAPLVSRSLAGLIGLPVGLLAMLALYGLVVWRAHADLSSHISRRQSLAQI